MMTEKVEKILEQLKRLRAMAYNKCVRKGDYHFNRDKYRLSIEFYRKALDQKPDEGYPKKQIKKAQKLLKEKLRQLKLYPDKDYPEEQVDTTPQILARKSQMRVAKRKYNKLIKQADERFSNKQYIQAKKQYSMALDIKPAKEYPRNQISYIEDIVKRRKSANNKYKSCIKKANEYFNSGIYLLARDFYQKALKIKPDKDYPRKRIRMTNGILQPKHREE